MIYVEVEVGDDYDGIVFLWDELFINYLICCFFCIYVLIIKFVFVVGSFYIIKSWIEIEVWKGSIICNKCCWFQYQ